MAAVLDMAEKIAQRGLTPEELRLFILPGAEDVACVRRRAPSGFSAQAGKLRRGRKLWSMSARLCGTENAGPRSDERQASRFSACGRRDPHSGAACRALTAFSACGRGSAGRMTATARLCGPFCGRRPHSKPGGAASGMPASAREAKNVRIGLSHRGPRPCGTKNAARRRRRRARSFFGRQRKGCHLPHLPNLSGQRRNHVIFISFLQKKRFSSVTCPFSDVRVGYK